MSMLSEEPLEVVNKVERVAKDSVNRSDGNRSNALLFRSRHHRQQADGEQPVQEIGNGLAAGGGEGARLQGVMEDEPQSPQHQEGESDAEEEAQVRSMQKAHPFRGGCHDSTKGEK